MKQKKYEKEFVEFSSNVFKSYGLDELTSKIFAITYITPKEIAMEDLAKITGYSLASVHNKTKILIKMGFLKKVKHPGTKKVYLYCEKSITNMLLMKLKFVIEVEMKPSKTILPNIIANSKKEKLTSEDKAKIANIKSCLDDMLNIEKLVINMEKDLIKLQKRKKY